MSPATAPRSRRDSQRLLHVDARTGTIADLRISDLPMLLEPADLLVVNDAATLPAALGARTSGGALIELRLAAQNEDRFLAVVFGAGDWRTPTELRRAPPELKVGDLLEIGGAQNEQSLRARVVAIPAEHGTRRLIELCFNRAGSALYDTLYRYGKPIQYAYLRQPLSIWDVQNVFASRPWSFELPSAGNGLSWDLLFALRARGVRLAWLTHSAGISSTGSCELDRHLPLRERYDIPEITARAIADTRSLSGRVIAVGTTVVRALESAARRNGLVPSGEGQTELRLDSNTPRRIVDAILSGMHEQGSSHYDLLEAFAPAGLLRRSAEQASRAGYLQHEFGDACLITGRNTPKSKLRSDAYREHANGLQSFELSCPSRS